MLKLVDTSSLLHSGNALFPNFGIGNADAFLNQKYSFPTGAMYNVLLFIKKQAKYKLDSKSKDRIIFCFDRPSFRKKISKEYKSNRPKNPGLLLQSIELEKGLKNMGFDVVSYDGMEADDLIAALVEENYDKYSKIEIYATDRDLSALVDNKVSLISTNKRIQSIDIYNYSSAVVPGYYIPYNTIYLFKLIFGDKSDCIPSILPLNSVNHSAFLGTLNQMKRKYPNIINLNSPLAIDCFIETISNESIRDKLKKSKELILPKRPANVVLTPEPKEYLDEIAMIDFLGTFKMKSIAKHFNIIYDPSLGNDKIKNLNSKLHDMITNNKNMNVKNELDIKKLDEAVEPSIKALENLF